MSTTQKLTSLQKLIRDQVQQHGRFVARLQRISANKTIAALQKDGYGTSMIARNGNIELWEVTGEP